MAITLIPMAIIPQIILANLIAPVENVSAVLAKGLITVYWGNRGLDTLMGEKIAEAAMPPVKLGSVAESLVIVFAHTVVFMLAALVVLFWQGRGARAVGNLMRRVKGTNL